MRWLVAMVVVAGLCVLPALRIAGHYRVAALTERFERSVGPLDRTAYRAVAPMDKDNAAVWLRKAAVAIDLSDDQRTLLFELMLRPSTAWSDDEARRVSSLVAGQRDAFDLLARAETSGPGTFGEPFEPTPGGVALLDAGRLLGAAALLDLRNGNVTGATAKATVLGRLAESLQESYSTTALIMGTHIELLQLGVVHDIVCSRTLDGSELNGLRAALLDNDPREMLRRTTSAGIAVHGRADVEELRDMETAPIWESLWYSSVADLMLADLLEASIRLSDALSLPWEQVEEAVNREGERSSMWSGSPGPMPSLIHATGRTASNVSVRRLARVAIELRLRALASGSYPESLEGLIEFDEIGALTTRQPVYERLEDGHAVLSAPGNRKIIERDHLWIHAPPDAFRLFQWKLPTPRKRGTLSFSASNEISSFRFAETSLR